MEGLVRVKIVILMEVAPQHYAEAAAREGMGDRRTSSFTA